MTIALPTNSALRRGIHGVRRALGAFAARAVHALPRTALAVLVAVVAADRGAFAELERGAWDLQMAASSVASESEVATVVIDDHDYVDMFGGRRPLAADRLASIVDAIALGKPKAIGVVIDTQDPAYAALQSHAFTCPVVWARAAAFSMSRRLFFPGDVLGSASTPSQYPFGLSVFLQDSDGVVRKYTRSMAMGDGTSVASLPHALLGITAGMTASHETEVGERWSGASGCPTGDCRISLSASAVMHLAQTDGFRQSGPLRDKIVLIGSDAGAQDEYKTPFGWMTALRLTAWALETELAGGGRLAAEHDAFIVLALFSGIVVSLALERLSTARGLLASILLLPVASVLCSLIAAHNLTYAWFFLPVTGGVVVLTVIDRLKEDRIRLILNAERGWRGLPDLPPEKASTESTPPAKASETSDGEQDASG